MIKEYCNLIGLEHFRSQTQEQSFSQTYRFCRIIKNTVMHYFQGKKWHMNGLNIWQKPKKRYFGEIWVFSPPKWEFSRKSWLHQFLTVKTIHLNVQFQKNSVSRFKEKLRTGLLTYCQTLFQSFKSFGRDPKSDTCFRWRVIRELL